MANPPCMSDDGNVAEFVGTMLETGDGYALCPTCLVSWCAAMLATMTGIDPTPFLMAISDDVADIDLPAPDVTPESRGDPGAGEDPPSTNGKSGRTPRASRAAGTGDDPPPVDQAASTADASPAA